MKTPNENGVVGQDNPVKKLSKRATDFIALLNEFTGNFFLYYLAGVGLPVLVMLLVFLVNLNAELMLLFAGGINYFQEFPRGRASTKETEQQILAPLVDVILAERDKMTFSPTLRGWGYVLEGLGICTKGDFDDVQARITRARKNGMLPLEITAEDTTRSASAASMVSEDLRTLIRLYLESVPSEYSTTTIEMFSGIHLELVVEKLDLVGLLEPVTSRYCIPVSCLRGWTDMHSRAALLKRCASYDLPTVVLMFGDHDVGGLSITDSFKSNLNEVFLASRLARMPNLHLVRVGLNAADIERLGLLWIDGLETSSGKDLGSPMHKNHFDCNVQAYIREHGKRKCEANALLRNPKAAEQILIESVRRYVSDQALADFEEQRQIDRRIANRAVTRALAAIGEIV
ncbi:MAG: hypothetical protein IPN53_26310 [Comamonadaceae bacterium]|nr:hypothetical protein [Comamonadaceae bacterium]